MIKSGVVMLHTILLLLHSCPLLQELGKKEIQEWSGLSFGKMLLAQVAGQILHVQFLLHTLLASKRYELLAIMKIN